MENLIELRGVGKRYGALAALHDVTVSLPPRRIIGLLGHNGAGKSTLIKLVLGLIKPSSGEIEVLGRTPWAAQAVRQQIGYLPESVAFYRNLTGNEVIDYFAALKRAPRRQARELLERVGLQHAADRRVGTYSKGMRQRLGVAQALLGDPRLVILDEPTTGLDPQATRELYAVVDELRNAGRGVLISSHLLAELEPHIDGALILSEGRLLASGTLAELRDRAGLPSVARVRLKPDVDLPGFARGFDGAAATADADGTLAVTLPGGCKVDALRRLLATQAVVDVELEEPTLARLYDWLGSGPSQTPRRAS